MTRDVVLSPVSQQFYTTGATVEHLLMSLVANAASHMEVPIKHGHDTTTDGHLQLLWAIGGENTWGGNGSLRVVEFGGVLNPATKGQQHVHGWFGQTGTVAVFAGGRHYLGVSGRFDTVSADELTNLLAEALQSV
jgi:hypothetical protein